jgi:NhaP-type Na+/H+ or K+/H+ antiporter
MWDPWKTFFSWLAGSDSDSSDLCHGLEKFYTEELVAKGICPNGEPIVFPKSSCDEYIKTYEARCNASGKTLTTNTTMILIIFALLVAFSFQSLLKRCYFITESGIYIVIGAVFGVFLYGEGHGTNATFDPSLFFLVLIPHIILSNGLSLDVRKMHESVFPILVFSLFGTIISTVAIGLILFYFGQATGVRLDGVSCGLFGALISSLDPSATRRALMETKNLGDEEVDVVIQGEAVFNDIVSVAAFYSLLAFINHEFSFERDLGIIAVRLVWAGVGSLAIGACSGIASALFFKYTKFVQTESEVVVFLAWALGPYYLCDALEMSGVVATTVGSMMMSTYTIENLSPAARANVLSVSSSIGKLMDTSVYIYMGVQLISPLHPNGGAMDNVKLLWQTNTVFAAFFAVLIARFFVVLPLSWLCNLHSKSNVLLMLASGMRGPVSYALAMTIPRYDEVTGIGSKDAPEILAITTSTILFFTFIVGGLTNFLIRTYPKPSFQCDTMRRNDPPMPGDISQHDNVASNYSSLADIGREHTNNPDWQSRVFNRSASGSRGRSSCASLLNSLRNCLRKRDSFADAEREFS